MVHVIYDVNATGKFPPPQLGGIPYFEGLRYQRGFAPYRNQVGHGVISRFLGNAYRNFLVPLGQKYLFPAAKEASKLLAQEAKTASLNVLSNVAEGKPVVEALREEAPLAGRRLARATATRIKQTGGKRKRRIRSLSNLHLVGKSVLESTAKEKRRGTSQGIY